ILSCLLHPQSPTHPSTLILSQGESSGDEELSDGGSLRVIHPPSPDYMPGPEHPPSPVEVPYVPDPKYPEYFVPSDVEAPLEDQPLPVDASPAALSPGYVADSYPDEDPEEIPEEDHADYPAYNNSIIFINLFYYDHNYTGKFFALLHYLHCQYLNI
ncbi:hypothetical protein Tco_0181884, partial [Tanacetum coccineum]